MKHIKPASAAVPARAQDCSEVSIFSPNKDLFEFWCLTDLLRSIVLNLESIKRFS